jgi:predicted lysophospholipase L1 biosynthesis ABC-type transport system permease subunit
MVGLALSAVGLLVGGVGVVAIMMISVTERTREIGVRKALGATKGTILWQFLVEAATLTSIGAIIGLVGGAGVAALINALSPIPASVPAPAIVAALLGSAFTGILFGMMPGGAGSAPRPRGSATLRIAASGAWEGSPQPERRTSSLWRCFSYAARRGQEPQLVLVAANYIFLRGSNRPA